MVRPLVITPVLNGFVVKAGCQSIVFTNAVDMGKAMLAYYENPERTENHYRDNAINKALLDSEQPQAQVAFPGAVPTTDKPSIQFR